VEACSARDLGLSDARRLDVGHRSYAIYRDHKGRLFATDGMCTHGNTHLSSGLVKGDEVECPKHNGRFRLADGAPSRAPACQGLATYPVEERQGRLFVNLARPGGAGARPQRTFRLRVAGTRFVATFIKELLLEPAEGEDPVAFTPGDYLKLDIPAYDAIRLGDLEIPDRYRPEWERQGLTDLVARNPAPGRRNNYSIASNSRLERTLRFDVRLASPPQGKSCPPGAGSSWVFSLQEGDPVTAVGPFGDFHVRPTQREMVYIGGGAGMAPLRAHLSHHLETLETSRRISFYYGARSLQEAFYLEYFEELARRHPGFSFHLALSMPLPEDRWTGQVGLVHEVALRQHLRRHPSPRTLEYYLCGPPPLIRASTAMLAELEVPAQQVSFDEF
jgi:Na(+)-translocating NADH:ubiquinone oxidoreductase F subunit